MIFLLFSHTSMRHTTHVTWFYRPMYITDTKQVGKNVCGLLDDVVHGRLRPRCAPERNSPREYVAALQHVIMSSSHVPLVGCQRGYPASLCSGEGPSFVCEIGRRLFEAITADVHEHHVPRLPVLRRSHGVSPFDPLQHQRDDFPRTAIYGDMGDGIWSGDTPERRCHHRHEAVDGGSIIHRQCVEPQVEQRPMVE